MQSNHLLLFIFGISLLSLSCAIDVIGPVAVQGVTETSVVDLGTIGPGQTTSILINPTVTTGGKFGTGGRFDFATISNLPYGWRGKASKLYGDPLQVEITADKNAKEGEYTAMITVQDEGNGELLGNPTFIVKMRISHDVLDVSISPKSITTGPGQPARFVISITNKGTASDVFKVQANGVERWVFEKPVLVQPLTTKTVIYEISEMEEETYSPEITVVSTSSNLIQKTEVVRFTVQPDLLSDFKATNHGIMVFPIFEAPIYAIAGLLSNLW
ncbi:MAG: hypothetical protein WCT31_04815 [Candidatus Micrarchaeia archaeon]|jgi:hypothetical protein